MLRLVPNEEEGIGGPLPSFFFKEGVFSRRENWGGEVVEPMASVASDTRTSCQNIARPTFNDFTTPVRALGSNIPSLPRRGMPASLLRPQLNKRNAVPYFCPLLIFVRQ